jgi:hypothetical protein
VKHLQIKNIPPELHEALQRRAHNEGMTMSNYVIKVLERDLSLPSEREWLARLQEREPADLGDEVVKALHEARAEREAELDAATRH